MGGAVESKSTKPSARADETLGTLVCFYLFPGGVSDDPAVDVADAHRAHGPVPGDVGGGEGGRGRVDGHDVGVRHGGGIYGEQVAHKLRLQAEALGEGCQMAKLDPFLSLDCARGRGWGRNSRKGRTFCSIA